MKGSGLKKDFNVTAVWLVFFGLPLVSFGFPVATENGGHLLKK